MSAADVLTLAKALKIDAVDAIKIGYNWHVYLKDEPKVTHFTLEKNMKARGWWMMASGYDITHGHYIACTTPALREAHRG